MSLNAIRVAAPALFGREVEYVTDCLAREELAIGSYVGRFEHELARLVGVDHAVACNNGTAALHLALLAAGVSPGDVVLVPALTYVATANAVTYCGAVPAFCDIDPDTWCIDPQSARAVLEDLHLQGHRATAIIPVHLFGVPANMNALSDLADEFGLVIIEDAAQAIGATYAGHKAGSLGDLGCFSLFGNKIITTGEGGVVTTSDPHLDVQLRLFRGQGVSPTRRYWHTVIGYNYRMPNVLAAIGLGQVERLGEHLAARAEVARRYREFIGGALTLQRVTPLATSAHWMVSVLVPEGVDRDRVVSAMADEGVETRPFFYPLPDLPPYRYASTPPAAAHVAARGVNLPTHANLRTEDIALVCEVLMRSIEVSRRGQ